VLAARVGAGTDVRGALPGLSPGSGVGFGRALLEDDRCDDGVGCSRITEGTGTSAEARDEAVGVAAPGAEEAPEDADGPDPGDAAEPGSPATAGASARLAGVVPPSRVSRAITATATTTARTAAPTTRTFVVRRAATALPHPRCLRPRSPQSPPY
jgi:hypothetical protein